MAIGLSIGDKVKILIDPPGGVPVEGIVRVIQDKSGKLVGVETDHLVDYGHSLDRLVEERTDPVRGITVGKGWWTLPENVEVL